MTDATYLRVRPQSTKCISESPGEKKRLCRWQRAASFAGTAWLRRVG